MRRTVLLFIIFIVASGVACNKYSRDPDLKLARDFIDAYYVFASQRKALPLTVGAAREEIEREMALLKDVPHRQEAYRSRDVLFELKKRLNHADETIFLFELTIKISELGDRKEMIHISVDRKLGKVKYFGTVR